MSAEDIQNQIDALHYWDVRVTKLECNYFADGVLLVYDVSKFNVFYNFIGCYKVIFDHDKSYDKLRPVKEMNISQMPYFLQDVRIGETVVDNIHFYTCNINMFPLYLEIWCKDITVTKQF